MKRQLSEIAGKSFDVAVIGGGITGAGVARHAAQTGLSVVLLEASDFAAGTSSRSTKLIHGGLRYLAMGDVGLVRETALERKHLFRMAPHLTEPKWMVVPAAGRLTLMKYRTGITAYEHLGAVLADDKHQNWDAEALETEEPLLDRKAFPYACAYREYLTDDARLVMATLRGAARLGAQVANYVRVDTVAQSDGTARLGCTDGHTGESFELEASVVVNATGPWAEQLLKRGGDEPLRLHLSKGVHIGVPRARLPVRNIVMTTAADDRPVFAIPRGTVTYVGTTDTSLEGGPDLWPEVERSDVDYLLEPLRRYFPTSELTTDDVVSAWAGLRPLINQPGKAPKEMSRKEEVWRDGRLVTIAGGKLTGFRKMAEQVMAEVADILGRDLAVPDPFEQLPGGAIEDLNALRGEIARRYQVDEQVSRRLLRLYGSEVFDVLGERPSPVTGAVFAEELHWAVEHECASNVEDLVYRRLRVPWFRPEETEDVSRAAATYLSDRLRWDDAKRQLELDGLTARLRQDLTFAAS